MYLMKLQMKDMFTSLLQDLMRNCSEILNVDLSDSLLFFREMEDQGLLKIVNENVYLLHYYLAERNIEYKISALCGGHF